MGDTSGREPGLISRILLLPFTLLFRVPPVTVLLGGLLLTLIGIGVYYSFNSDFFGLASPPLAKLIFANGFQDVTDAGGRRWLIHYESDTNTTFEGIVRHVSHWREDEIPFATHDILVTTEDFTSQDRVHVSVLFHTFTYKWFEGPQPTGTINLLHIVPASPEIYRQLLDVRDWNYVSISGQEILRIERFDPHGNYLGAWQDAGCNSIRVDSVAIVAKGTPVP